MENSFSLEYTAVARKNVILAQFAASSGNYDVSISEILLRLNPKEERSACERSGHKYFILQQEEGLNFVVVGPPHLNSYIAYDFLGRVQRSFLLHHARTWQTAPAYGLQNEFSKTLENLLNEAIRHNRLEEAKSNLQDTQNTMSDNLQKALLRGDNLQDMENSASSIAASSNTFGRSATSVRRKMLCMKYRFHIVAVVAIVLIIIIIIIAFTGKGNDKKE
ncbi:Vesicle-associated membrane protein 714 [Tritrichomonas foetus]|uniref:Vesicle-associated membrane protein 714 n=1 Tax=Tritrichomonas foetus TaxID=1144522 RepID=A0A1J4JL87_9EUKA|nr:Vesicle-associated membrane protein 714 [Tritrichomonas foetus]|eukprot:OHS99850.1 Vesicle-associated membrane protein 714 [Tritrichomonas foetus]